MTRKDRTPEENWAIKALTNHLEHTEGNVSEDDTITDAPDFVFSINDRRIACEFRLLAWGEIMKWYRQKKEYKKDVKYVIKIPIEPNFWMNYILDEKNGKIPDYLTNSKAKECWLAVHTSHLFWENFTTNYELIVKMFADSCSTHFHDFDRVYFICSEPVETKELWRKGNPKTKKTNINLTEGYPVYAETHVITDFVGKDKTLYLDTLPMEELILTPMNPLYDFPRARGTFNYMF